MTHYQILGLVQNCHQSEVKKAYYNKVKIYHPDINPDPSATDLMIKVNEAYEVLSDVTTRNLYDLYLKGIPVKTVIKEATPEQRYKAEYIRNKIRKQREQMEYEVRVKQRFYRYYRFINMVVFVLGAFLTVDYYYQPDQQVDQPEFIGIGSTGTNLIIENGQRFQVGEDFYYEYLSSGEKDIIVFYSSVLKKPARVKAVGGDNIYILGGTLYSFKNVFSIIILIFSAIVIKYKRYSDFRLSSGLIALVSGIYISLYIYMQNQ